MKSTRFLLPVSMWLLLLCLLSLSVRSVLASEVWYQYALSPQSSANAKLAHSVFDEILRANPVRIKRNVPKLFVVYSRSGSWSASLPDGSLLLSSVAVSQALKQGKRSGMPKLAFLIAHELELMQMNSFWHRQYFVLAGASEQTTEELQVSDLTDGQDFIRTLKLEDQASRNALQTLSALEYDVMEVGRDEGFLSQWINANWKPACGDLKKISSSAQHDVVKSLADACSSSHKLAKYRQSAFTPLVADQMLFTTGYQAYLAGEYKLARIYLEKYTARYSHARVHFYLGNCYLMEALKSRDKFIELGGYHKNIYHYPVVSDAGPALARLYKPILDLENKTGDEYNVSKDALQHKEQINRLVGFAVTEYEKSIKLNNGFKPAYLNLIAAYLTQNNVVEANKILFSKYKISFGNDNESDLYGGILHASFRRIQQARVEFSRLTRVQDPVIAAYAYVNLAQLYRYDRNINYADAVWKKLQQYSHSNKDVVISSLTDPQRFQRKPGHFKVNTGLTIAKMTAGSSIDNKLLKIKHSYCIAVDAAAKVLQLCHYEDGARVLVNTEGFVHAAWQDQVRSSSPKYNWLDKPEQKIIAVLGAPDYLIALRKGRALVYSDLKVVLITNAGKVIQWMHFPQGH